MSEAEKRAEAGAESRPRLKLPEPTCPPPAHTSILYSRDEDTNMTLSLHKYNLISTQLQFNFKTNISYLSSPRLHIYPVLCKYDFEYIQIQFDNDTNTITNLAHLSSTRSHIYPVL